MMLQTVDAVLLPAMRVNTLWCRKPAITIGARELTFLKMKKGRVRMKGECMVT
jgi:hypothetical protein